MKVNLIFVAFAFVIIFILGAAILLWRFSFVGSPHFQNLDLKSYDLNSTVSNITDTIQEKIANLKRSDLPANIMYIKIDKDELEEIKSGNKFNFELVLDNCDLYSVFCLNRLTKNLNIELTIVKVGEANKIFITSNDIKSAQILIADLKRYNINSQLVEIKK